MVRGQRNANDALKPAGNARSVRNALSSSTCVFRGAVKDSVVFSLGALPHVQLPVGTMPPKSEAVTKRHEPGRGGRSDTSSVLATALPRSCVAVTVTVQSTGLKNSTLTTYGSDESMGRMACVGKPDAQRTEYVAAAIGNGWSSTSPKSIVARVALVMCASS